jgi:transcriptional regulator with XRE-family HTH domain
MQPSVARLLHDSHDRATNRVARGALRADDGWEETTGSEGPINMRTESSLGAVIRARRIKLGLTQEQLAERISDHGELVRQSEISRIESGKITLPRRPRLERLAAALGLSLGELLACSGWAAADRVFDPPTTPAAELPIQHTPEPQPTPQSRWDWDTRPAHAGHDIAASELRHQRAALHSALGALHQQSARLTHNRQTAEEIIRMAAACGVPLPDHGPGHAHQEISNSPS